VRYRGNLLRGSVAGLLVLLGVLVAVPVNVISGYLPSTVTGHRAWWIGLLIGAASMMAVLTWLSGRLNEQGRRVRLRADPDPASSEWVDREQVGEVVKLLTVRDARGVGETAVAGLAGAGGFGKTTLAEMVRADPRIMKRFSGGSLQLRVGQGVRGAELAEKINAEARKLSRERPGSSDPEIAGQHLMELLDTGPRRLLIVDDVWSREQLVPFHTAGDRCALLVTTRIPDLLPSNAHKVVVDQMSAEQARQMIKGRDYVLPGATIDDLVRVTGRWPLVLSLVAARLRMVAAEAGDVRAAAQLTVDQITREGPTALDMKVKVAQDRTNAVSVNVGLSLDMLPPGSRDRFAELAIFIAETPVPTWVIARLWAVTSGLSEDDSHALCRAMGQLSLVRYRADSDTIQMHEVIRAYMQAEATRVAPLSGIHAALLDGLADALPVSGQPVSDNEPTGLVWWRLPEDQDYLWDHLARHIAAARPTQFDQAITDLRWIGARLTRSGPAAALADLSHGATARSAALRWELTRTEHLLGPAVPPRCVSDVLLSRLRDDSRWHDEVDRVLATIREPHLINRWPLPDVPDEQLRRTLKGHEGWVTAVAIGPDGTWLASGSRDGTIRIWDAATGRCRNTLTGHKRGVEGIAIAPDGTWLASTDGTTTIYVWDVASERLRISFDTARDQRSPSPYRLTSLALSPDGAWLATVAGTVSLWSAATGQPRATQAGGPYITKSVAISPDGHWLAAASENVHIWDATTGEEHHTIVADHADDITFVTFSPDGTWLATVGGLDDRRVKLWDAVTGQLRCSMLTGHSGVFSVAISAGGRWLATIGSGYTLKGNYDDTIQLWDTQTGEHIRTLGGISLRVLSVAISPDETWLAAGDQDGSIRTWDLADMNRTARTHGIGLYQPVVISPDVTWLAATKDKQHVIRVCEIPSGNIRHAISRPHLSVDRMVVAPDGTWFAAAGLSKVWIWSAITGSCRFSYSWEDDGPVQEIAVSPRGDWLATGHWEGTVRIWDIDTRRTRITFPVHADREQAILHRRDVTLLSVSPDGTWLATAIHLDRSVRIWDTTTGELRYALTGQHPAEIVAIAPSGEWLATAGGGVVHIWDTVSGNLSTSLNVFDEDGPGTSLNISGMISNDDPAGFRIDKMKSVTIPPDATWIATTASGDSRIRIWNSATGQPRATLKGGNDTLTSVAVSPDGTWIAAIAGGPVVSDTYTVMVWSTTTWECVASTRVNGRLDLCAWTPDGRYIVLNGAYGTYLFEFHPEEALP
jgi:WD40 repeat protein